VNWPPALIGPESNRPVFDVEVCVMVSLFRHVTLPPTATVTGFGEYAFVVSPAEFMTIDTVVPDGLGVGDEGDDEPQPNERPSVSAAKSIRIFKDLPPGGILRKCPALWRQAAIGAKSPQWSRSAPGELRSL